MGNALLKLHIEAPGTLYKNPDGEVSPSLAGHAWMELVRSDGTSIQAGFGPSLAKTSVASVEGKIFESDRESYAGDSYFSATYVITEGQAKALERFISLPEEYGFDKAHYHAVTNSCVDFVWKGLQQVGMNPERFEGDLHPMSNIDNFSNLKNPLIPGGGLLNVESRDVQPVMEEPMVSPFNDWWWAAPAPWISVSPVPAEDAYLPRGTITVGPLSPPVPVQQDGTNYADGTGYQ
ncbi:hypothetical protein HBDW_35080 [Herbaspirillum sp. DW155]|uniref:hypothetical protein n=1 Tax=Herbaspirillum sp. DW155 TaxID=3095609 RepID=UPI00308E564F|nr:hypothetical protein HBDW_35080 [Herbaspirillum sp. DW155]